MKKIYPEKVYSVFINGEKYEWDDQQISGSDVRRIGGIPLEDEIYLTLKQPKEEKKINDDTIVDLSNPGIEKFFSKKEEHTKFVQIIINGKEKSIIRGEHTVNEIKILGDIQQGWELEMIVNQKLTPLKDDATIFIKGGDEFVGHVRDGSSS